MDVVDRQDGRRGEAMDNAAVQTQACQSTGAGPIAFVLTHLSDDLSRQAFVDELSAAAQEVSASFAGIQAGGDGSAVDDARVAFAKVIRAWVLSADIGASQATVAAIQASRDEEPVWN